MKDYEAGTLYRHTYYEYDSLGRISAKAESNSEMTDAEKSAKAVSYTYNLRGEVTGTGYGSSLTNIAAGEISGTRYEYNSYGQITGVYVRKGTSEYKVKEYSYTPSGNVMQVKDFYNYTSGTGWYIALSYSYDAYGRVTAMVYEDSNGAVIEKHEYAYNRNGQVVKETNLNNVSVNPVNETRSYAYDYMGNLLKSEITGSTNVTTLYTYDKVGNRLTKKQNNVTTTYTYNGLNQLTGESGDGNSLNYVYDANGNQIRITGTADGTSVNKVFAYTPSGNMTSYTNGTVTQVNRYNGDGQRVSKTEGSDVTNYFYQDGSVLYTTDSQGNVKAFNLLNVSDILGTLRINGNNVSSYFYTEDMRGSIVNVIDNSGNTVLSYWYDDFGQVNEYRESGNSLINEVQYTGAIYDELTGLLYLNARFYDPATGRFISQDTYRGERDDAGTWHLYAYCANDPVNYVDPSGHSRWTRKLTLGDYRRIHNKVADLVAWTVAQRKGKREVFVKTETGKRGYLDVLDIRNNIYYEIKSERQGNKPATIRQMARYDVSHNRYFKYPAKRGTNKLIKGTFYYGAHLIKYKYTGDGGGLITYKVVDYSERRAKQMGNALAGAAATAFIVGGIIFIAATGGSGASVVIPAFVLAL